MADSEPGQRATVAVDRIMLHDLVNHLTIVLGHSDLLLMELDADGEPRQALSEIRDACRRAVDLVEGWRARLPPDE